MSDNEANSAAEDSFISHLVELRDRLLRSLIAVAVVLGILCIYPGPGEIYDILAAPLTSAAVRISAAHAFPAGRRTAAQFCLAANVTPVAAQRRPWKTYLVPAAAAALVAFATLIFINLPADSSPPIGKKDPVDPANWDHGVPLEIALLPAPGPVDASARNGSAQTTGTASGQLAGQVAARDRALATTGEEFLRKVNERLNQTPVPPPNALPQLNPRDSVPVATHPVLPLPVHAGRASLSWITHAVRTEGKLPAANAIRLEEVLNHFNLRPVGGAGISQGVSIATESLACPWKPSATLLLLSIRGATDAAHDVTASFHADPAAVSLYRLLGFAPVAGISPGPLPSRLPAKAITTIAIEIEPAAFSGPLGSIEWSIDGKPAAAIPVARHSEMEPSDDARFAALVCAYAQWLAHDQPLLIDAALVSALTRESTTSSLAPDRRGFAPLVDQSHVLKP